MRRQHHVLQLEQLRVNLRLLLVDIEAGGEDAAVLQRRAQGGLVDDRAAGGVDEHRGRLHPLQLWRGDQVPGRLGQRYVDADEVRLAEQRVEVGARHAELALDLLRRRHLVVVDDAHSEAARPPRHAAPDPAETDDAERRAADVVAEQHVDRPAAEGAAADEVVSLQHPAAGCHQEREGEVGRGVVEDTGGVGDHHAVPRGGGHVDVVEADRHVGDDLQPWCAEHLIADCVHQLADHPLRALG